MLSGLYFRLHVCENIEGVYLVYKCTCNVPLQGWILLASYGLTTAL